MVKMSEESVDYGKNIKKFSEKRSKENFFATEVKNQGEGFYVIKRILKGSLVSMVITIALLIIFSLLLTYTSLSENTIPIVTLIITGISILIGSQISTIHIKRNGLTNGMAIGVIYILSLYLLSSIISGNFGMSFFSIMMIIISILMGAIRRNNRG